MKQDDDAAHLRMRSMGWGCVITLLILLPVFVFAVPLLFLHQGRIDEDRAQERADRLASSFADDLDTLLRSGTASDRQIQSLGTTEKRLRSINRTGSTVEVDLLVRAKKGSLFGVGLISKCFTVTVDTAVLTDRRHRVTPVENCQ
jgi:hypothetical protein